VRDPNPLNALCRAAELRCVNIDLPGNGAPSVVSHNRGGARALSDVLVDRMVARDAVSADLFFLGGVADEFDTASRIAGFADALAANAVTPAPDAIQCCGYAPTSAAECLAARHGQLGRLPAGLFVSGVTALAGSLRFMSTLPAAGFQSVFVGSFDWDPFAGHLPFDVTMIRQDGEAIAGGFAQLDRYRPGDHPVVLVPTPFGGLGERDGFQEDWDAESGSADAPGHAAG
jgi:LacI family fructose operon transcriptional repressor